MKIRDILIVLVGLILDILTKLTIVNNYNLYESKEIINNFFSITYIQNNGAAWSILEGKMLFFYVITIVALGFIFYLYKSCDSSFQKFSIALVIAGTIGNFIDRIRLGYVVDFLDFIIFGYDFPVFNVADMCLVVGCALLIVSFIKEEKQNGKI
jgi:signal peptidase II